LDGGSDARLSSNDAAYAKSGNYAVRLRDNTDNSVMTHEPMNVSNYTKMRVKFSYYAKSMEDGEDFWLQVNDGSGTWENVAEWFSGADFTNDSHHDDIVDFTPSNMSSDLQIRFRCDASESSDYIYIDDVEISGWGVTD
jgi:hypothetical protein